MEGNVNGTEIRNRGNGPRGMETVLVKNGKKLEVGTGEVGSSGKEWPTRGMFLTGLAVPYRRVGS